VFCSISVGHIVNYYYVTLYNQSVTVHLTSGAETAYPSEGSRNCLPFWREQELPTLLKGAGTVYPSEGSRNCLPFWREQELPTLLKGAGTAYPSEGSRNCLPFWREQELSTLLKGAGTVYLSEGSRTVLSGVHVTQSEIFCLVFCQTLFVFSSFFFWSLFHPSFLELWLVITF
jgi:hypothetical protein